MERIVQGAEKLGLSSSGQQVEEAYGEYLGRGASHRGRSSSPGVTAVGSQGAQKRERGGGAVTPLEGQGRAISMPPSTRAGEESLNRAEVTLLENLASHPECFQGDHYEILLEYISSSEVQQSVKLLKSVYFEVDEGHYSSMVQAVLRQRGVPSAVMEAIAGGLFRYTPSRSLDEVGVNRLLESLSRKLKKDALKDRRVQLIDLHGRSETDEEGKVLLGKIGAIDREINGLNAR